MIKNTQILISPTTILGPISSGKEVSSVSMFFCNTNLTSVRSINLFVVPSGVSIQNDSNIIVKEFPIPQGDTLPFSQEKLILSQGDKIVATANENGITQTVSYIEL